MEIRIHLEKEIDFLRRKDNKFKVPTERLILMAANNSPKKVNDIRYHHYDEFKNEVERLVEMKILMPIGKYRENVLSHTDFWILPKGKDEYDIDLFYHVLSLYTHFDMSYYHLKYSEFTLDKSYIDILHKYISGNKLRLTSKELGLLLFNNENFFELVETEELDIKHKSINGASILKKLNLTLEDLNSYHTVLPIVHKVRNSFYSKDIRKILIIEKQDSFYAMALNGERWKEFDMLILGCGQLLINSFRFAKDYEIKEEDEIFYFGDVEMNAIYQYSLFKQNYKNYNIGLFTKGYKELLRKFEHGIYKSDNSVTPYIPMDNISCIIKEEFEKGEEEKIMSIFLNRKHIPQEAIGLISLKNT